MSAEVVEDLPRADHATRRARAVDHLRASQPRASQPGATHLLVTRPVNVRYLTGFTGSNGQLLLGPDPDEHRLLTDARYDRRAAEEAPDLARILERDYAAAALELVAGRRCRLLAEADHLSWNAFEALRRRGAAAGVEVADSAGLIEALRTVKDTSELARLQQACDLTTTSLEWVLTERLRPGCSEREVARWLEQAFLDAGADGVGFPTIVAAGPNGAVPHHNPSERRLRVGELVTIDCGAQVDGYHADYTRTVAVGDPPAELAEVYELVRLAQAEGRAAVGAGVTAGEVDRAARQVLDQAGYGEAFLHGTGHGVGLEVHEAPMVARGATATLADGMTLTVEPGVYLPGRGGIRIEDTLVVAPDVGSRALTDTPRQLRIL